MNRKFLTIIVYLFPFIIFGQNFVDKDFYLLDSIDLSAYNQHDKELLESSLTKFHSAKDDTSKILALKKITEEMMHQDWERYQYYEYELIKGYLKKDISVKEKRTLLIFKSVAINNIGYIYDHKGDLDVALNFYKSSIKISELIKDTLNVCSSLNNVGLVYHNKGNIPLALEYFHKSLKIQESWNNYFGIGAVCNNIGMIYHQQRDFDLATKYNKKSLAIQKKIDDKRGMAISYNNLGVIYRKTQNLELALEYFEKSAALQEEIMDYNGLATSMVNVGHIYLAKKNQDKALQYFNKSFEYHQKIEDKAGMSVSLSNIGEIEFDKGNLIEAEKIGQKAYAYAKETGFAKEIDDASELLSKIYERKGNYKLSFDMYKEHILMRDSVNGLEAKNASIQLEAKYRYEQQKAIDDAAYQKQLAIEQEEKEKQTIIAYTTGGGLGLVGIFLIFVFNRLKVTQKQKNIIHQQKSEVEQQKNIIEQSHEELKEKNKEITDSIVYAKRIQAAILPPQKVVKQYLQESFILYKPKDIVAGDFYWMESLSAVHNSQSSVHSSLKTENCELILFAAADCTGHGVPGAMVSVVCNNGLNRSVREYGLTDPGKILDKTREIVIQEFEKSDEDVKDGMDIALCCLRFDVQGLKLNDPKTAALLQYAGANNPLWIIRNNELIEFKANKQPVGNYFRNEPYITHEVQLQKGDAIYIFTDGYADQFGGEKGKKFMYKPFKELLLSIQTKKMEEQKEILEQHFESWKGNLEQVDDVCIIGVRI